VQGPGLAPVLGREQVLDWAPARGLAEPVWVRALALEQALEAWAPEPAQALVSARVWAPGLVPAREPVRALARAPVGAVWGLAQALG
jgi:hypothetical protein